MPKLIRWLSVVGAVVIASHAYASSTWYTGSVQYVYPMNDGSFAIGVATSTPVCSNSGGGGVYMHVTPGQNGITAAATQNMLATVLTAFAAGRSIEINYDNSTSLCYVYGLLIE